MLVSVTGGIMGHLSADIPNTSVYNILSSSVYKVGKEP